MESRRPISLSLFTSLYKRRKRYIVRPIAMNKSHIPLGLDWSNPGPDFATLLSSLCACLENISGSSIIVRFFFKNREALPSSLYEFLERLLSFNESDKNEDNGDDKKNVDKSANGVRRNNAQEPQD